VRKSAPNLKPVLGDDAGVAERAVDGQPAVEALAFDLATAVADRVETAVDETNSRGHDYSLADDDGTYDESIAGWMDWQAIKDMEDDTFNPMKRQGQQSGRCSGTVANYYEGDAIRHFDTEATEADGDSGGPHFDHNSDGDAMVSGMHRARHLDTGHSRAGYIDDLYDEANLYL
jgi:hypothetical protein